MATEEVPKESSTSKSGADAEIFQLEALSLNYLRSQNISVIPDSDRIPKLHPCKLCNKSILNFRFEAFTILACGHIPHRLCIEKHIMQGGVRRPSCPI
ncbi:6259_t:CDS:1, partial [Acaulospora morrowiae]